jgi:hypothetical protein
MQGESTLPSHMEAGGLFLEKEDASGGIQFVRGEGIDPLPKPDEPSALDVAGGLFGGDSLIFQDMNVKRCSMRESCMERSD